MCPSAFSNKLISEDLISTITNFHDMSASISFLQKYLLNVFKVEMTNRDISKLISIHKKILTQIETQQLEKEQHNGKLFFIEKEKVINSQTILVREGVLSISNVELENIKRFGDILFMDMTQFNTSIRWNIVPLVLINNNKKLMLAGFFACKTFSKENYVWCLNHLLNPEIFGDILCTIISDSDSTLLPAVEEINNQRIKDKKCPIAQILCTWHKKKNLLAEMAKLHLSECEKTKIIDIYETMITTRSTEKFNKLVNEFKSISPQLSTFMDKKFLPFKEKLAMSYVKTFNMGYMVSSPSESCNNMLKYINPRKLFTLTELRHHFDEILIRNMTKDSTDKFREMFPNSKFIQNLRNYINKSTIDSILKSMNKAKRLSICQDNERYIVQDDILNEVFVIENNHCSCNKIQTFGLICSHMIKYCTYCGVSIPVKECINHRYFENNIDEDFCINFSIDNDEFNLIQQYIENKTEQVKKNIDKTLENEPPAELVRVHQLKALLYQNIYDIAEYEDIYKDLFSYIESILKRLPVNIDNLNPETLKPENEPDNDIIIMDDSGSKKKKRGPKPIGQKPHFIQTCCFCGGDHKSTLCQHYQNFQNYTNSINVPEDGRRKCSLCNKRMRHKADNCVFLENFLKLNNLQKRD